MNITQVMKIVLNVLLMVKLDILSRTWTHFNPKLLNKDFHFSRDFPTRVHNPYLFKECQRIDKNTDKGTPFNGDIIFNYLNADGLPRLFTDNRIES